MDDCAFIDFLSKLHCTSFLLNRSAYKFFNEFNDVKFNKICR
jgi:hypothetical protein